MTYATLQNLTDRYGEREILALADRDGDGQPDAEAVARALAAADEEIDAFVGLRYALPLAGVPALLRGIAEAIARYKLDAVNPREAARDEYADAQKMLAKIGRGEVSIGLTVAGDAAPASAGGPKAVAPEREFTRESLKGFTG